MSSSHSSATRGAVPIGYVHLNLVCQDNSWFYLQIPIAVINSLCLKPYKYLKFLGWCILGAEGVLSLEDGGNEVEINGTLDTEGIYYYVVPGASGRPSLNCHCYPVCL